MIKKSIYPKTSRVKVSGYLVEITEKLDGSNLCIFKKDDKLYVAQRNNIICIDDREDLDNISYRGLFGWVTDNYEVLNKLHNNSVICGEWLGMGKLKYSVDEFDKRFYMFAKANIDDDFNLYNIQYTHENFIYPFEDMEIPKCIGIVPVAYQLHYYPTKTQLDMLYKSYCEHVGRNVEGLVVNCDNNIKKYVRMKNGKLQEHFE